ncbi:MAG: hypothetical protein KJ725_09765 [Gammaproteobacteria bacterium]|nr:hypothetical protein [Gammaproteobacteria bacterium]
MQKTNETCSFCGVEASVDVPLIAGAEFYFPADRGAIDRTIRPVTL